MSEEFAPPAASIGLNYQDLLGKLLIIMVKSTEQVTTKYSKMENDTEAIKADIIVVEDDEDYNETLIFPRVLVSQLRPRIGARVLGRLEQGTAKPGQDPPWRLADATPEDAQRASALLRSRTAGGLTAPAPARSDAPPF